ncbi:MAG: enolase C-terminal domain-like protein [Bacteroidota bacterium]
MTIETIDIYSLKIPFTTGIDHNLKRRKTSDSIVLAVRTTDGKIGYGEGTPRSYVTGETTRQVVQDFLRVLGDGNRLRVNGLDDIRELSSWLNNYYTMTSMVTALEIALLDLLGQYEHCCLGDFFAPVKSNSPIYSGVLPFLPVEKRRKWLELMKSLQLKAVKIKVGREDDVDTLTMAREILGPQIDIRLDANQAWSFQQAMVNMQRLEDFKVSSVEEPLSQADEEMLPELSEQIQTPILLDESLRSLEHLVYFTQQISADKLLVNIKLSKVGGLFAAHEMHAFAAEQGIDCQLGCHVGESAILSAAGRLFAQTHTLRHLEGSFAPYFMEDDIATAPIAFGAGGKANAIHGPGLGVSIDPEKLRRYGWLLHQIE